MAQKRVKRRLAAILAADVVGYSRLVGMDEEGTIARLKALRDELIDPGIARHGGRIVKTMGDGVLAEFPSVVDAVRNAVEVQKAMAERNADVPADRCIEFRVGVNLGDIVVQDDDIFGDGVNVAARLEGLAEPGGVCISGAAFDQIENKLDVAFEDLGAKPLKNIAKPVRVYRLRLAATDLAAPGGAKAPELPDKPSIAVLPFANMSGDAEQEYFADGITEDIITALARVRQIFVIARNSTFIYKGRSVDVQVVARELGVRYVLEGSVRKAANRVRITAQLIESATRNHIWADRYDRALDDVFAVQDEITQKVVGAIGPEVSRAEQERARMKPPENLDAWDNYQRGLWHLWRFNAEDNISAVRLFARSVEQDPSFSSAFAGLSYAHIVNYSRGFGDSPKAELSAARASAARAIELDHEDAMPHWAMGMVNLFGRDFAAAIEEQSAAIEINPNYAPAYGQLGTYLAVTGRCDEAFPVLDQADRLSPKDPMGWMTALGRAYAYLFLGQFDEAAASARRAIRGSNSLIWAHTILVAALTKADRQAEAAQALAELLRVKPDFSLDFVEDTSPNDDARRALMIEALREAGAPER